MAELKQHIKNLLETSMNGLQQGSVKFVREDNDNLYYVAKTTRFGSEVEVKVNKDNFASEQYWRGNEEEEWKTLIA